MSVESIFSNLLADTTPPAPELVADLIEAADALICGYLCCETLPVTPRIDTSRAMLALVLYNRRGAEGEIKRVEGDVASWFETLPEIIKIQLRPFRNARAVTLLPSEVSS